MGRYYSGPPGGRLLFGLGLLALAVVGIAAGVGERFAPALLGVGAGGVLIGGVGLLLDRRSRRHGRPVR